MSHYLYIVRSLELPVRKVHGGRKVQAECLCTV